MRSIPFVSSFVLLSAFLVGCPGDGKDVSIDTDTGIPDSGECLDADGDGYDNCEECDDTNAMINPGAEEECDGVDNDCDGELDEGVMGTYYADADGDGFGDDAVWTEACEASDGWVPVNGDCNDEDPYIYPGAEEICDGTDNDCNDTIDDGLESTTYYQDSDGDTYGNPDEPLDACEMPDGYTDNSDDCDDLNELEPVHADSVSGSPSGTGTMTNPVDTIQGGIDQAEKCVYVMPGTYNENIDFSGKNILVKGVDGPESTFIVGTGDGSVVTIASGETADARLTGFTITGGTGTVEVDSVTESPDSYTTITTTTYWYFGGGLYVNGADPSLDDLIVTDNELPAYSFSNPSAEENVYVYSYGGGAFFGDSTTEPWDIWFIDNYADNGGGAYVNGSSTLDGRWIGFDGNSASAGGGLTSAGSVTLNNSILVDNASSSDGGAVGGGGADAQGGSLTLNYVTAASNEGMASVYLSSGGSATLWNSIVANNDSGYGVDGESGTSLSVTYSDVYGGASGNYGASYTDPTGSSGNISADPEFMSWSDDGDFSDDDLTLAGTSPCVDAGDPASTDADGSAADMGAYGGADGGW